MDLSKSSKRSSWLPFELVEEILYKTPIKSLAHFKWICKQWYALINEKKFMYKHIDLCEKQFIQVHPHNESVQLFDPETQALSSLQGPTNIYSVIHCDRLLLCQCWRNGYTPEKLAVWNPFLSQVEWIKPNNFYKKDDVYGFGYDNVSRDNYKILRLHDKTHIEIYEFKSKLWKSVNAALDSCVTLWYKRYQALSMNGNMYWIAQRKKGNSKTEIFIQSFDFSRERFKDIGCSVPLEADCIVISGFKGDRLALLRLHEGENIEVWVTNKFLHVTRPDYLPTRYFSFPTYFIDKKTNKIKLYCGQVDVKTHYIDVNVSEIGDGDIK
ncbi:hypothetical protein EUTSA_v10026802mg [Eutrema salsugineum]|uniref:F-box domain-containing protein n=1 Tax=Eutrema salsugineum TaxID=72664 RepID=V4P900_EUTSA|nr:hypothetical protein EUTSA_v10026802mg [Eutrema salsugineum]